MSYKYFDVKRENRVAVCTINNPPVNFMNGDMVAELLRVADELEVDPEARFMVFTGGGNIHYSLMMFPSFCRLPEVTVRAQSYSSCGCESQK